jgi:2,4-dienoyl-CoA reductase-like NADH-dependent reductase (Old Yellow Enzyme family)
MARKFAFIGSNFSFRLGRRWLEFEESIQLSKILKKKERSRFNRCFIGGAVSPTNSVGSKLSSCFCRKHKKRRESTGAVGLITEAAQAEQIIASGKADLVLFAENLVIRISD